MRRPALLLLLLLGLVGPPAAAQVYTPQAPTGLSVAFQTEHVGGPRVIVFGEVRNSSGQAYERITLLAEGLDDGGQIVSRGRGYALGTVAPRGRVPFEVRIIASGREKRYRVSVESYQLSSGPQSP